MSNYTKILKANTKKQSVPEALFGKEKWEGILTNIVLLTIWTAGIVINTLIFNSYGIQMSDNMFPNIGKFMSIILSGTILTLLEAGAVIGLVQILLYFFITIPVRLQRRYLPFTEEEMRALPFETEGEFYDFLLHMCSRKPARFIERIFVDSMRADMIEMLALHNQIIGKPADYIWEGCHEELLDFLKKEMDEEA